MAFRRRRSQLVFLVGGASSGKSEAALATGRQGNRQDSAACLCGDR